MRFTPVTLLAQHLEEKGDGAIPVSPTTSKETQQESWHGATTTYPVAVHTTLYPMIQSLHSQYNIPTRAPGMVVRSVDCQG